MTNIVVIEDNEGFVQDARETIGARVVKTLAEFDEIKHEQIDYLLSDLYFPTGYEDGRDAELRTKSIQVLDDYIKRIDRPNPLGRAVDAVIGLGVLGNTLDEYLENLKEDVVVKRFKDNIIQSYKEHQQLKQYEALRKGMQEKTHDLPAGMFAYEQAKTLGIPCIIVTSAYHHGIEFQPFVHHVGQYIDTLVDGKKPWKQALERLSMR